MMQLYQTLSIVIGISIPLLVLVFTKLWDPVAEYVGYPFDVRRRVNDLGDAVERLQHIKSELLRLDPHPLSEQRVGWLRRVDKLIGKAEGIKAGLNCFTWCYFGKKAGKELQTTQELASQGQDLLQDARERPRPFCDVHRHQQDGLFGMDSYMKNVLHFLEDEHSGSSPLGIWGMGGVGKSSLLKLVKDSSSEYDNHVLFIQADADCTVGKLQRAIVASMGMGLPSYSDETLLQSIIFNHLKDKNFLLLLDDLWIHLDLDTVGIPMPLGKVPISGHRRKVIFTTTSLAVCTKMRCSSDNTIRMECLSNEDAWKLFTKMTGDNINSDAGIREHAIEIVKECGGLPMALCMIGQHMSDKKDHKEWRTTKELWKMSKLHIITTGHQHFFKRLKEGYDNMTDDMKQCFLLCSLWSENENISMEDLIRWWIGLGFLDVSNGNDTGYAIIKVLVRASMLEKGDTGVDSTKNTHVKMHNMIRKMALWIVNKGGYQDIFLPKSAYRPELTEENWLTVEKAWVSQEDTSRWCQWSSKISFPQLKMLVAQHVFSLETIHYFEKITFLDMEGTKRDRFPDEICRLIHLQHLNLSATTIKALPLEVKNLSKLKYLYIRNNMVLEIPKELILGLKSLRGMDLFRTSVKFLKVQCSSSLLDELADPAINLPIFGFTLQKRADVTKLETLKTRVCTQALCMRHFEDESHMVDINLQLLSALENLRELAIEESSHTRELVAEGGPWYEERLLPYLEIFELNNLPKLEKVTWKNAGMDITVVSIYKCDKLKDVTWVHHLNFLEQLTVSHCKELRRLIEKELLLGAGMIQTATISFPILKKLKLEELPKLSMICNQACEFKELSYICVTQCNEMKDIKNQIYRQEGIPIVCSEDWWNQNTLKGFRPCLVPKFPS